jgi:hypothetical protein
VAPRLDASAERIIDYLSERHGVDINAVFFRYSKLSDGREILARTILMPDKPPTRHGRKPEAYRRFFQGLIDELREHHKFTGARSGQPQSWYAFSSGRSRVSYGCSFAQGGKVRTDLYIDLGEKGPNKDLFDRLASEKERIEADYGESLQWERLDDRRASRIAIYRHGSIDDAPETLVEIRNWAVKQLLMFKKIFGPRLSTLPQVETEQA